MAEESTSSEAAPGDRVQVSTSRVMRRGKQALDVAVTRMRGGLREAEQRLEEEQRDWDARAAQAALPDIGAVDPIADLAIRVDRESDYWRTFAVRNMRPGAARNLAIAGAALALSSGLAAGTLATLAAILGAEGPAVASMETAAGVALCAVVACVLGIVSERGRTMAAHHALARADHAERRLERIAAILALKSASEAKYLEALSRLERDR
jgi:hypothetical protein